ncbi:MAG: acyltransferase [Chloroflexota bacterium]|nr:acyltransferase [Chloroflexota bacterium]
MAQIGKDCSVGVGAVIEAGAQLGRGCVVGHYAVVHAGTQVGQGCHIGDHAVLGRPPRPASTSTVEIPKSLAPLRIDGGTGIGTGAVIYRGTTIGRQSLVGDLAFVREQCTIGDCVIVGTHVTVENEVTIGSRTKIQSGAYIAAWSTIEEHCFIAPCVVTTNDNTMGRTEKRFSERGGAVIRRGARIGAGATLLPNIEVGSEAFVAAGSIVTRSVPPRTLVMGSPARIVRDVPDAELVENQ